MQASGPGRVSAIAASLAVAWAACALAATEGLAQVPAGEAGRPRLDIHRHVDFGGGPTSSTILPMPDGRIAVSNTRGLAIFDGARWRLYTHPQEQRGLLAMARTPRGEFCGGFPGEIGCFRPDVTGGYRWHALHDRLPAPMREYNKVAAAAWDEARRGLWFAMQTQMVFVPDAAQDAPVLLELPANGWRPHANGFVVYGSGQGLFRIGAGGPPRLERLAPIEDIEGKVLVGIHDLGGGRLLTMQLGGRASLVADGRATRIWAATEDERRAGIPSAFRAISGGRYALGLQRGPLTILDAEGRVLQRMGADAGLDETAILDIHEDREGGLWITQSNRITRIDQASATSFYGPEFGHARVSSFHRWQGRPFITSQFRLLALDAGDPGRFLPYAGAASLQIGLVVARGERMYASGESLFAFDTPGAAPLRLAGAGHVSVSRLHPDRLYTLIQGEFSLLRSTPGGSVFEALPQPLHAFTDVVEEDDGTLWMHRENGQLSRMRPAADGRWQAPEWVAATGLPAGQFALVGGRGALWAATRRGVWRLAPDATSFEHARELPVEMQDGLVNALYEDPLGNLWMQSAQHTGVAWREGSAWRWDAAPLSALDPRTEIFHFVREGDLLWVMKADGLARIDLARQRLDLPPSQPILTGLRDLRSDRAMALDGSGATLGSHLRLEFGLPAMQRREGNLLRFRLAGFSDAMSQWSTRSEAEYANLGPGDYAFEVQARDALGRVSRAELLRFSIPPPWYRHGLALAAWTLLALAALAAAARLGARRRQRQMLVRQRELEATVTARTEELRASNAQLAAQAERLAEVDRMKTRFFINVGHEFRTPLTLVLGPLDDLLQGTRGRLADAVRAHLQLAQRNARRVLDLIVELLDVNRLEQGQLPLRIGDHDLAALLRRIAADSVPLLERYGQRLRVEVGDAPAPARIDPMQVERCVGNLLGNAAKYSPRGTQVLLALAREDGHWAVYVRDHGRGIAPEALPHVFDRFFQAEGSEAASGYGIGLSLVREIALAHGGDVSVSSELGVGSCFTLRLPVAEVLEPEASRPPEPAPEPVETQAPNTAARGRERVLIVDDHADLRARVRELLGQRFEILEAADGEQAWQLARDELPDLLVSDVMMPGCDGVELTRRLRAHADTATIGVLLLTAKAGSEHAVAGLQAGANDYLAKPFDAGELLARCEAIVAHARRLQHRLAAAAPSVPPEPVETQETRWRQRLDAHIAANLHEPGFGVEELAERMHADRTHLFRRCKEVLGMSPSDYLREARLAHGHELLERAAGNISEVAYASGFDSLSSFTRAFKARYGVPPSQVRARMAS